MECEYHGGGSAGGTAQDPNHCSLNESFELFDVSVKTLCPKLFVGESKDRRKE